MIPDDLTEEGIEGVEWGIAVKIPADTEVTWHPAKTNNQTP